MHFAANHLLAALSLAIWIYLLAARGAFWRMHPEDPVGEPPRPRAFRDRRRSGTQ